jgi:hypothetical protein
MHKLIFIGAAALLISTAGLAAAQERLPQHSGFGMGVGESSGTGTRSQIWDRSALLERLSQPETIYGRVVAFDLPAGKLYLESGGSSHDEGRAGAGSLSLLIVYVDDQTNMEHLKVIQAGDDVSLQVVEDISAKQPFGTGRKLIREMSVLRGNETLAGYGGLGQHPDPRTERAIFSDDASINGGIPNQVQSGEIKLGISSDIGQMTGAAPCWQCDPQPGWSYDAKTSKSDWLSGDKLIFDKK